MQPPSNRQRGCLFPLLPKLGEEGNFVLNADRAVNDPSGRRVASRPVDGDSAKGPVRSGDLRIYFRELGGIF